MTRARSTAGVSAQAGSASAAACTAAVDLVGRAKRHLGADPAGRGIEDLAAAIAGRGFEAAADQQRNFEASGRHCQVASSMERTLLFAIVTQDSVQRPDQPRISVDQCSVLADRYDRADSNSCHPRSHLPCPESSAAV